MEAGSICYSVFLPFSLSAATSRGQDRYMPARAIRGSAALRARELWVGLAIAVMLAACELPSQRVAGPTSQTASRPPAGAEEPTPVAATPAETRPKIPVPPPPKPSMEPQALVGLGEEEITRVLGEPREVRNDPPAMVWNYVVNECRLDLFFYLDLKSQDFRALAYNFEPNTTSDGAKKACLARIQEANRDRRR